jgi:hypothetical protein
MNNWRAVLDRIYYSFAIQLVMNNLKKNQVLLLFWLLLIAIITGNFGRMMGIPYLFLDPEYMGQTDWRAFLVIGLSLGVFIMSFHITIYILDSYKFPFLGGIPRPFSNFCLNNSPLPVFLVLVYVFSIIRFQFRTGFQNRVEIFWEVLALLVGLLFMIVLLLMYFRFTNKDIFKFVAGNLDKTIRKSAITRVNVMRKLKRARRNKYHVSSYFSLPFNLVQVPDYFPYDKANILKVFDQNHLNAVVVEFMLVAMIILLGLFRDFAFFQIPAAASGILFFSMIIMFTGAFSYWLRGWSVTLLIVGFFVLNLLIKYELVNSTYQAFGLNYHTEKADYRLERLSQMSNQAEYQKDKQQMIALLDNWKAKFPDTIKPKMVFICSSGGGQRAAVWTLRTLQHVDSSLNGALMNHSILMTGASGGLIGASYYRELYLQSQQNPKVDPSAHPYFWNMGKDVLNPIIYSMLVNDFFIRFQKFSDGKYEYYKDRGYAFEQQLNKNTFGVLDKRLMDYREPEFKGHIPMVIASPTVVNDGRKLFISSQPIAFMTTNEGLNIPGFNQKVKGIEFSRFFAAQDASNLHYLSALRMSATFPYVTPNVELPSSPGMEIMDAGLSDNFGIRDAVKFMYVFKDWIKENTSGVVFVNIRDSQKDMPIEDNGPPGLFKKALTPIGTLYNNWDYFQDLYNDNLLEYTPNWLDCPFDVIEFEYIPKPHYWEKLSKRNLSTEELNKLERSERAVLSWHLTQREKESLFRTIYEANNKAALTRLRQALGYPQP